MTRFLAGALLAAVLPLSAAAAQALPRTLTLSDAHTLASDADPRAVQAQLLERQSTLRRTTLGREALPALSANASGQYLSDVTSVPGAPFPAPFQHQYDAQLAVRQTLFDPTRPARTAAEQAQFAESAASLRGTQWQDRQAVNDAFFGVLLAESRVRAQTLALDDLSARRALADARRAAGSALTSEVALLDAELARREQARREAAFDAAAAREVLGVLIGRPLAADESLAVPSVAAELPAPGRERPEFDRFAEGRRLVDARRAATAAQRIPRVALVGRAGYGRPGLNQLGRDFDTYYVAGLQVEWTPWTWGATQRDEEVQALQARILQSEETAFARVLERAAARERARIAALSSALETDARIVDLRATVLAEARRRHDEGELTAADYVARLSESLAASLDRDIHRIQLAEARVRYLTTIGHEVR